MKQPKHRWKTVLLDQFWVKKGEKRPSNGLVVENGYGEDIVIQVKTRRRVHYGKKYERRSETYVVERGF